MCDISESEVINRKITSCAKDMATFFEFQKNTDDTEIIRSPRDNNVWDVGAANYVKIFTFHGGSNQRFKFENVGQNKYRLLLNGKCIEYNPLSDQYDLNTCSVDNNQLFSIFETIQEDPIHNTSLLEDSSTGKHDHINTPFDREKKLYNFASKRHAGRHHSHEHSGGHHRGTHHHGHHRIPKQTISGEF